MLGIAESINQSINHWICIRLFKFKVSYDDIQLATAVAAKASSVARSLKLSNIDPG